MNPKPLTPSILADYDNCAHKAYRVHWLKDVSRESGGYHLEFGNRIHKALEYRARDHKPLPQFLSTAEPFVSALLTHAAQSNATVNVENFLGVGPSLLEAADTRIAELRCKTDIDIIYPDGFALIGDWKTGKVRTNARQLKINALAVMAKNPQLHTVIPFFVYLKFPVSEGADRGDCTGHELVPMNKDEFWKAPANTITRSKLESIAVEINDDISYVRHSERSGTWPKSSGPLCGWCPVDDCEHWLAYSGEHRN